MRERSTLRLGYEGPAGTSAPEGVERRDYADGVTWTVYPVSGRARDASIGPAIGLIAGGGLVVGGVVMFGLTRGLQSVRGFGWGTGFMGMMWAGGLFLAVRAWNRARTRVVIDLRPDQMVVLGLGPLWSRRMFWARGTIGDVVVRKTRPVAKAGTVEWRYQIEVESEYGGRQFTHVIVADRAGEMLRELATEVRRALGCSEEDPTAVEGGPGGERRARL